MFRRVLWVYWEMAGKTQQLPAHIALCRKVMQRRAVGYDLNVVTPANVLQYIPDLSDRVMSIALNPRGLVDRYFRRRERRREAIALRADYIRAFLLERHGGLYIDSDAIIIGDLGPIFELIEKRGFAICRRETYGKSHVSVGFYGSVPNGPVIREYSKALRLRLSQSLDYDWNEVGADLLTPIVDQHVNSVAILPEKLVQPVTFEEANVKFVSTEIQLTDVVTPDTKVFMLFSGPFKGPLSGLDEEKLLGGDSLVSKAFRHALAGCSSDIAR